VCHRRGAVGAEHDRDTTALIEPFPATNTNVSRPVVGRRRPSSTTLARAAHARTNRAPYPAPLAWRIQRRRARGGSLQEIAEDVNETDVPIEARRRAVRGDGSRRPLPAS
jgi:hypothetical protein